MRSMQPAAIGFAVLFLGAGIALLVSRLSGDTSALPSKPTQQEVERKLLQELNGIAATLNRRGEVMVAEDVRWVRTSVGPGMRLNYFYVYPNHSSKDVDRSRFLADVPPRMKKWVCGDKTLKPLLNKGVAYVFSFSTNDAVELTRVEASAHDCAPPPP